MTRRAGVKTDLRDSVYSCLSGARALSPVGTFERSNRPLPVRGRVCKGTFGVQPEIRYLAVLTAVGC